MTRLKVLFVSIAVAALGCATSTDANAADELAPVSAAAVEPSQEEMDEPVPEPASSGRVARSVFTTAVAEREPTDELTTLTNDVQRVLFFTDLQGLQGRTVVHRWLYRGEVQAEVPFEVGGPRWRVHSSKGLDPAWLGEWTVSVVADGEVLVSEGFTYTDTVPADAPVAKPAAAPVAPPAAAPVAPPAAPAEAHGAPEMP